MNQVATNDINVKLADIGGIQNTSVTAVTAASSPAFSISDLMLEITKAFQSLRDVSMDYVASAARQLYNQQMAAIKQKKEAIEKEYKSAQLSGGFEIAAGGTTVIGGAGGMKWGGLDVGLQAGSALGRGLDGTGKVTAAEATKDARTKEVDGDFQQKNAEQYGSDADRLRSTMDRNRSLAMDTLSAYRELYDRALSAIKIA